MTAEAVGGAANRISEGRATVRATYKGQEKVFLIN